MPHGQLNLRHWKQEWVRPMSANRVTAGRIVLALALGALAGGVGTIAAWVASSTVFGDAGPVALEGLSLFVVGAFATIVVVVMLGWFSGLVLIGGPLWLLFHRLGLTSRLHAMLLGALAAGAAGYVLGILGRAPHPIAFFIVFAIIGMGVGFLVRKVAYGRKAQAG